MGFRTKRFTVDLAGGKNRRPARHWGRVAACPPGAGGRGALGQYANRRQPWVNALVVCIAGTIGVIAFSQSVTGAMRCAERASFDSGRKAIPKSPRPGGDDHSIRHFPDPQRLTEGRMSIPVRVKCNPMGRNGDVEAKVYRENKTGMWVEFHVSTISNPEIESERIE